MKSEQTTSKPFSAWIKRVIHFLSVDIFRVKENELTSSKRLFIRLLKKLILSIREYINDLLPQRASSLTYYTTLAIIPIFALVLAIGRGFGFQDTLEKFVVDLLGANSEATPFILQFVNSYLEQAHGGVFVGVGVIILLWSVVSMFRQIEATFNYIWSVKKSRSIIRQFTTYISILVFVPVLIVLSSSLLVRVNGWVEIISESTVGAFFIPIYQFGVRLLPYIVYWLLFTLIFVIIPNTKVKWADAFIAGVITGTAFVLMQYLYVSGMVNLSRYNAVYGSFAAIPLLLLMVQISWMIVLYGAEFTFVSQNLHQYSFDTETRDISRRYKDYLTLVVLRFVVKRFEGAEPAPTVEDISIHYNIPIRLVQDVVQRLVDCKILSELYTDITNSKSYQPALDINAITVSLVFQRLESSGSESFMLSHMEELEHTWSVLEDMRKDINQKTQSVLIKDL